MNKSTHTRDHMEGKAMRYRVLVVYEEDGERKTESVWATQTGEHYVVASIPFFARNLAMDDVVEVASDGDTLRLKNTVRPSGNSVVRLVVFDERTIDEVCAAFTAMGCDWEVSHVKHLIAVHIPKDKDYWEVKRFLDAGEFEKRWVSSVSKIRTVKVQ